MSEELKKIVTKIVTDHPEVEAIYSNWKPNGFGGVIFVQIPQISQELSVTYQDVYTQYVWDNFEYMTDDIRSVVIFTDVMSMEVMYELIFNKSTGGFTDAI